jgi:hypothetical protein
MLNIDPTVTNLIDIYKKSILRHIDIPIDPIISVKDLA